MILHLITSARIVFAYWPCLVQSTNTQCRLADYHAFQKGSRKHGQSMPCCRQQRSPTAGCFMRHQKCVEYIHHNGGFMVVGIITRDQPEVKVKMSRILKKRMPMKKMSHGSLMPHAINLENRMAYQLLRYKCGHIPSIEDGPKARNSAKTPVTDSPRPCWQRWNSKLLVITNKLSLIHLCFY